ncbi:branched-chain amino acid ABC transporter permease [Mesorhizobium sp. VNQ89]|uniref:branched-chain amino acid ABC transporter permease n=1 Tax=Mesorhizobium quangtriensis TaxID=3157709 RepID=UPI0032B80C0F
MLQVFINSIVYASEIAVIAVGVSLSYSVLRFANFAHIQLAIVGGYLTYSFAAIPGLPMVIAVLLAAIGTGIIAVLIDVLVFSRIRGISAEGKMIVSWGVALFIRSMLSVIYGGSAKVFDVPSEVIIVQDAVFTTLDITVVVATAVLMVGLHAFLYRTRTGSALRALASNYDLAVTRGIPGERLIRLMWFLSGALAAVGGSLFAMQTRLQPSLDLVILLPVFAAVTIGGMSNVFGAVIGALVLSFAQNFLIWIDFGTLFFGEPWHIPTQFRDYIAVLALLIVLLLKSGRAAGGKR